MFRRNSICLFNVSVKQPQTWSGSIPEDNIEIIVDDSSICFIEAEGFIVGQDMGMDDSGINVNDVL